MDVLNSNLGPVFGESLSTRKLNAFVANVVRSREVWLRKELDERRDINDECGYPNTESMTAVEYQNLYDREAIAARVVEVFPLESWVTEPDVYETEEDIETEFESRWNELPSKLRGTSWYKSPDVNPIYEVLKRVDVLSGIGQYGVLIFGIDDGKMLSEPVDWIDDFGRVKGKPKESELLYLRPLPESFAQISSRVSDPTNPRYGQPEFYDVTFEDPSNLQQNDTSATDTKKVHWSRVLHIADNLGSSEIFGTPRQQPVLNRILDLRKVLSGSAEMYWKGAFPGLSIETVPQIAGNVEIDTSAVKDALEQYMNGLQRYLNLDGLTAKSLSPQVVDPASQIEVQIDAICIKLAIPKRIFMGSERGELASSQDMKTWNKRMMSRQQFYITPRILIPFIDRCIMLGVLPEPSEDGYFVKWEDLNSLDQEAKAAIAGVQTDAMTKYIQGSVDQLIPPHDYLTRILGLDEEEVDEILEAAMEHLEEKAEEEAAIMEEQQKMMLEQQTQAGQTPQQQPQQKPAKDQPPVGAGSGRGF